MPAMHIQDFDPRAIPPNTRDVFHLDVTATPGGVRVQLTVLVVGGAAAGPVLLVSGGVHGDEYPGPLAIMRLYKELTPAQLQGTFVGLVVANPPSFDAVNWISPIDGLNLGRTFPGSRHGFVTQQIAYWMGERLIGRSDFYVDLHSGGSNAEMVQMCGYQLGAGPVAEWRKRMAESFHAEVLWSHPDQGPGRTLSYALDHGIPAVYAESPAGRYIRLQDVETYQRGMRNIMRVVDMLPGDLEGEPARYRFTGSGNFDTSIAVSTNGFFVPERKLLDQVQAGDLLGTVFDLAGDVLEEVVARVPGYVGLRQVLPVVRAGDVVFMLATREQ